MLSLSLAIVWTEGATSEWMIRIQQTSVPADGDLCFVLSRNGFFSREVPRLWGATCYIMDQSAFFYVFIWIGLRGYYALVCRLLRYKKLSRLFEKKKKKNLDITRWFSAEKMPWFRCVVMVRNPRRISGNTLLVSVSQGKKYLPRT